jgi:hypothetical protein
MAEHLLVCGRRGKGAGAVFTHEIRIRSAKIALGHRRCPLVDFSPGPNRTRLRDVRAAIIFLVPRARNSPAESRRLFVNNNGIRSLGNFVRKPSDQAPPMTADNNEHQ